MTFLMSLMIFLTSLKMSWLLCVLIPEICLWIETDNNFLDFPKFEHYTTEVGGIFVHFNTQFLYDQHTVPLSHQLFTTHRAIMWLDLTGLLAFLVAHHNE